MLQNALPNTLTNTVVLPVMTTKKSQCIPKCIKKELLPTLDQILNIYLF